MTSSYGMHGYLKAQPGQGDALAAVLLEAADALADVSECLLYVVSRSLDDEDTVWVTEAWSNRQAHDDSLKDERVKALIQRAMPLVAGPPEATELRPQGGKGLAVSR
ncbi:MAG: antibiotic biosynthesis monooxygenase [Actinomycetota bacterium]|nr:antibiotic biosynthesis monooxygenase [Actinomycetota bacterium]